MQAFRRSIQTSNPQSLCSSILPRVDPLIYITSACMGKKVDRPVLEYVLLLSEESEDLKL